MAIIGPPIQTVEDRRRLCLWLLDQVRQRLPQEDRELVSDIYRIESRINERRPVDSFAGEEVVSLKVVAPDASWLYEGVFTVPLYGGGPSFKTHQVVMLPSYSNPGVALRIEASSREVNVP